VPHVWEGDPKKKRIRVKRGRGFDKKSLGVVAKGHGAFVENKLGPKHTGELLQVRLLKGSPGNTWAQPDHTGVSPGKGLRGDRGSWAKCFFHTNPSLS